MAVVREVEFGAPNREVTGTTGVLFLVIKLLIHLIDSLDFFVHHSCIFAYTFDFRPFSYEFEIKTLKYSPYFFLE